MVQVVEQVLSSDRNVVLQVIKVRSGLFTLRKYVRMYDIEEEKHYVVRELPDPDGYFGDVSSAVNEARSVLDKYYS